jgi:lia operon protein LiaG
MPGRVLMSVRTPLAALGALILLPAIGTGQTESKSLKGGVVAVYNLVGRIQAVAGTGDAVIVDITRNGADAAKLKVETGPIGNRQTLRVIYPSDRIVYRDLRGRSRSNLHVRSDGTFSDGGWDDRDRDGVVISSYGTGLEANADLMVKIPRGQKVELYLGVGRMDVSNVEGDLLVDVTSADVEIAGLKGNLVLDTGSGRVAVRDIVGDLNIDTGSGGISIDRVKGSILRLDSGSGGVQGSDIDVREFNADVGSGGLRMYRMKASDLNVDTGSGGATIELLSVFDRLIVDTGSGGVTVRVPAALSAQVDVETGSGGFQTDFEITTRSVGRNHVSGRIGDGKGQIRIEAGSGSVRLLKS